MAKYDITIVVNGSLNESDATKIMNESKSLLKNVSNLEVTNMGLRDLAYPIKKINKGFYFVFKFATEDPSIIHEFRRVTNLTKDILRYLIINEEKDYAYKATQNPKKVARSKFRAERYQRIKSAIQAEMEKVKVERDNRPVKLTDID